MIFPLNYYENFVKKNYTIIKSLESVAKFFATFWINEENHLQTESFYAIMNNFALYHENILIRNGMSHQMIQNDHRFPVYLKWGQLVKFFTTNEVLIEMLARKYKKDVLLIILVIQSIKALIRLYIIYQSKGHFYLDIQNLPSDQLLKEEQKRNEIEDVEKAKSTFSVLQTPSIGKRTGKTMPTFDYKIPFLQSREILYQINPQIDYKEILYVLRPVIYVSALMKWGDQSWIPWSISLGSEYLSLQQTQTKGLLFKEELNKRKSFLLFYLFKSPMFENTLKPILQYLLTLNIPIIGRILHHFITMGLTLQQYYFYTDD